MIDKSFAAAQQSKEQRIPTKWRKYQKLAERLGGGFLLFSLALAPFGWGQGIECGGIKIWQAGVIVIWLLAPPIWFWYQFHFGWRQDKENRPALDEFNTYQDLSSKVWIATTSALLLLYFWQNIKR
jgi:hypothetical protein